MKALRPEELRLGNWVYFLSQPVQVTGIHKPEGNTRYLISTDEYLDSKTMHFKPIPLDESWLIRFGFEKIDYNVFCLDEYIFASPEDNDWEDLCLDISIERQSRQIYLTFLSYLHELQNLIYNLTKKELELSPIEEKQG